jgi:hypothetical protein
VALTEHWDLLTNLPVFRNRVFPNEIVVIIVERELQFLSMVRGSSLLLFLLSLCATAKVAAELVVYEPRVEWSQPWDSLSGIWSFDQFGDLTIATINGKGLVLVESDSSFRPLQEASESSVSTCVVFKDRIYGLVRGELISFDRNGEDKRTHPLLEDLSAPTHLERIDDWVVAFGPEGTLVFSEDGELWSETSVGPVGAIAALFRLPWNDSWIAYGDRVWRARDLAGPWILQPEVIDRSDSVESIEGAVLTSRGLELEVSSGNGPNSSNRKLFISTDGEAWLQSPVSQSRPLFARIFFSSDQYFGVTSEGAVWRSANRLQWEFVSGAEVPGERSLWTSRIRQVADGWIATDRFSQALYRSTNLVEWALVSEIPDHRLEFYAMASDGDSRLVAAGRSVVVSQNGGLDWEQLTNFPVEDVVIEDVIWDGSRFVAIGGKSNLYTSIDGLDWSTVEWNGLGLWMERALDGELIAVEAETSWLCGIAFSNGVYCMVDDLGILHSADLINWEWANIRFEQFGNRENYSVDLDVRPRVSNLRGGFVVSAYGIGPAISMDAKHWEFLGDSEIVWPIWSIIEDGSGNLLGRSGSSRMRYDPDRNDWEMEKYGEWAPFIWKAFGKVITVPSPRIILTENEDYFLDLPLDLTGATIDIAETSDRLFILTSEGQIVSTRAGRGADVPAVVRSGTLQLDILSSDSSQSGAEVGQWKVSVRRTGGRDGAMTGRVKIDASSTATLDEDFTFSEDWKADGLRFENGQSAAITVGTITGFADHIAGMEETIVLRLESDSTEAATELVTLPLLAPPLDRWLLRAFGSLTVPGAGPEEDPDDDGIPNYMEFFFGLNPHGGDLWKLEDALQARFRDDGTSAFEITGKRDSRIRWVVEFLNEDLESLPESVSAVPLVSDEVWSTTWRDRQTFDPHTEAQFFRYSAEFVPFVSFD